MAGKRAKQTGGIGDQEIRCLLAGKTPDELSGFLRKGMREQKAFRRKVIAWLIDTEVERLPDETARREVSCWIDEVFEQRSIAPRLPDLRQLAPVKSAVRHRPEVAVPAHLAIAEEILGFLEDYGGGPESFYDAFINNIRQAGDYLPEVGDRDLRLSYLRQMEEMEARSDIGYGLDAATGEILEETRTALEREPGMPGRFRDRLR